VRLVFQPEAWEDVCHWAVTDRAMFKRLRKLIDHTCRDPYDGIGKPEPLKHELASAWSRRIDSEHRLVYLVRTASSGEAELGILQARYHY
jgi:toxin YoeB